MAENAPIQFNPERLDIPHQWNRLLRDKEVLGNLVANLGRHREGVFIVGNSASVQFIPSDELRRLAAAGAPNPYISLVELLDIALRGTGGSTFNPAEDAIVALAPSAEVYEEIDRQRRRVRAWWARPSGRSVKLVNLDNRAELVYALVIR